VKRHNVGVFRRSVHLGFLVSLFCTGGLAQTNNPIPKAADVPHLYRVEVVAQNLAVPWALDFFPDGRLFFTERFGQIRVIEQGQLRDVPALRLTNIAVGVKMGLLGLAHDPGFVTNHFVYSAQNYPSGERFALRVVRYRESRNQLIEPRTIIEGIPAWLNHTGGRLRFGPDGMLYITTGDADRPPDSQRLDSLAGKILRLRPDGSIPPNNPFIGETKARPEIWSYGHRNPQGIDFHPTLPLVMATEHGPDHGDEVNVITRGANFGWPRIHHRLAEAGLHSPALEFTPAIAPASGMFYRGNAFPKLKGDFLVGCLRGEGILRVQLDGTNLLGAERFFHRLYARIRDVAESPEGYIYFTTSMHDPPEGQPRPGYDMILRIVPLDAPTSGYPLATNLLLSTSEQLPAFDPSSTNTAMLVPLFCQPCHGPKLEGGMQASLVDAVWTQVKNDQEMFRFISEGNANLGMPAFKNSLSETQIRALMNYIRVQEKNPRANPVIKPATGPSEFE
jgi:glucose/arabinose dehydrogenase